MILADKIIENRKKNGWSQEELADRLGVSRQSVSKWEGAQAVPDMKKIIQMSEIFGVSTDYLLIDDIEEPKAPEVTPVDSGLEETVRQVSMEEASAFLEHNGRAAGTISTGVMMCILSPVLLILLSGLAEAEKIAMNTRIAEMAGTAVLLIIVATAVGMFVMTGMRGKEYEYLENLDIDTAYGVSGMARERRSQYAERHTRLLIVGIMLCIIAAVPLLILDMSNYSNNTDVLPIAGVCLMIMTVAAGVKMIVLTCIRQDGFDKLLEEGDYTRLNKKAGKYDGVYWGIALAVYLIWSFVTNRWDISWIVWPIAGVLYFVYHEIARAIVRAAYKK
jgi:transcriptional regulator with XRE-family HTH domain